MRRNRLTRFTESICGRLDDDWAWRGRIGRFLHGFYLAYILMDVGPVQMASEWDFTTSGDKSSIGGVSPCKQSTVRLLIGH
jgi:hypothetical protein